MLASPHIIQKNWGQTPIKFDKTPPKELARGRKRMKEWKNVGLQS